MGKQFSFYLTPQDSFSLKKHLREIPNVLFLADETKEPKPVEFSELVFSKIEDETMLYLVHCANLNNICFHSIENLGIWTIDSLRSPVIEFSNCYFDGKTLGAGRMYYTTGYYENDGRWTNKNSEFLDLAQKVFRAAKKSLIRNKELNAYLGEEATELLKNRKIELSQL